MKTLRHNDYINDILGSERAVIGFSLYDFTDDKFQSHILSATFMKTPGLPGDKCGTFACKADVAPSRRKEWDPRFTRGLHPQFQIVMNLERVPTKNT
jgi:hypothetical protein